MRYQLAIDLLEACNWPSRVIDGHVLDSPDGWASWVWGAAPYLRTPVICEIARREGLSATGGDLHLATFAVHPPKPRPTDPEAWRTSILEDLVLLGDQEAGPVIAEGLRSFPRLVTEAFVRHVVVLAVGFSSKAWIGGTAVPGGRWPLVLAGGPNALEAICHECVHAWCDRAPGGPPEDADPIALARCWTAAFHRGDSKDPDHERWIQKVERRARALAAVWSLPMPSGVAEVSGLI